MVQKLIYVFCFCFTLKETSLNYNCTLFVPLTYGCFVCSTDVWLFCCTIPSSTMMHLFQLRTSLNISSRYVWGPRIRTRSRTAISTYWMWDVPVYSLVCISVGFCRCDITNSNIHAVEFIRRFLFKMKIETRHFGYRIGSRVRGWRKLFTTSGQPMSFHLVSYILPLYGETDSCQGL